MEFQNVRQYLSPESSVRFVARTSLDVLDRGIERVKHNLALFGGESTGLVEFGWIDDGLDSPEVLRPEGCFKVEDGELQYFSLDPLQGQILCYSFNLSEGWDSARRDVIRTLGGPIAQEAFVRKNALELGIPGKFCRDFLAVGDTVLTPLGEPTEVLQIQDHLISTIAGRFGFEEIIRCFAGNVYPELYLIERVVQGVRSGRHLEAIEGYLNIQLTVLAGMNGSDFLACVPGARYGGEIGASVFPTSLESLSTKLREFLSNCDVAEFCGCVNAIFGTLSEPVGAQDGQYTRLYPDTCYSGAFGELPAGNAECAQWDVPS